MFRIVEHNNYQDSELILIARHIRNTKTTFGFLGLNLLVKERRWVGYCELQYFKIAINGKIVVEDYLQGVTNLFWIQIWT